MTDKPSGKAQKDRVTKGGRPCKYPVSVSPYLSEIKAWAEAGASLGEIATKLQISLASLKRYQTQFPELTEALEAGFGVADAQVEAALFKRALGFEYEQLEVVKEELAHQGKKTGEVKQKEVRKQVRVLGDIGAQTFWLKNRRPELWREKQEVKHQGEVKQGIVFLPPVATDAQSWAKWVQEYEHKQDHEPKLDD